MKVFIFFLLLSTNSFSQWKNYRLINDGKDTINRIDQDGKKQYEWINRVETVRGEPGYEEEGEYRNDRKEGEWRIFSLMGDLIGIENYKWGNKDGMVQYFSLHGNLRMEQSWKALNPDKQYDTIQVEDVDKLESYSEVIIKNDGAALKHGEWKIYDPESGALVKTEKYVLGKLQEDKSTAATEKTKTIEKPKEVQEFEKSKKGKKVRFQDGSTF